MASSLPRVLACDDDPLSRKALGLLLEGKASVVEAESEDQAVAVAARERIDLVVLDLDLGRGGSGLSALRRLLERSPEIHVLMLSGDTGYASVREALRAGARDYLAKSASPEELELAIGRALERVELEAREGRLAREVARTAPSGELLGDSPAIVELRRTLAKLRGSRANVLITGETGTGKEVAARQLRRTLGSGEDGTPEPFVAVDAATIQGSMAESILFGHERGAFTGADRARPGLFEEADGGVLFLDEVGNLEPEVQNKLLRVLQEKEVRRLGSSRVLPIDFRVVAATNLDLATMEKEGRFRADLRQRLEVIPLRLPPLRERLEDLPALVAGFCARERTRRRFSPEALELMKGYGWPGNVRELGNVVAYVLALSEGDPVEPADLPPRIRESSVPAAGSPVPAPRFYDRVAAFEADLLRQALGEAGDNVSRAALALGMDRSHLHAKLKALKIR